MDSKRSNKRSNNRSNKSRSKCARGEIEREGYYRKGYMRNSFRRKDGTFVPSTYVSGAEVPPTCVKDMGKPGKGPRILPKPSGKLHLHKYGYAIRKSEANRRAALRAASRDNDTLEVLRHLNLLRNYQPIPENKAIFSQDVEYMKNLYAREKKNSIKNARGNSRGSKQNSRRQSQLGGVNEKNNFSQTSDFSETSESESDHVVDQILLQGPADKSKITEINTVIDREKNCNGDGKCTTVTKIYEKHNVNGKIVEYYTIDDKNLSELIDFNKNKANNSKLDDNILDRVKTGREFIIGITVDGKLQGYCRYELADSDSQAINVIFCTNKGYGTALHTFMKKYFRINGLDNK